MQIRKTGQFTNGEFVEWFPDTTDPDGTEYMTVGNMRYKRTPNAEYAEYIRPA